MKTLKNLTAAVLVAFTVSTSAFAADETAAEKRHVNYALKTYISAITEGKIAALPEVLDKDVKFTSTRGNKIISHNIKEVMGVLKAGENVKQNCSTTYSIVESTPSLSVVKVTMKYKGFSKVEYLNLANTASGWKITSVSTSFV